MIDIVSAFERVFPSVITPEIVVFCRLASPNATGLG
jgi:hypothetical protein